MFCKKPHCLSQCIEIAEDGFLLEIAITLCVDSWSLLIFRLKHWTEHLQQLGLFCLWMKSSFGVVVLTSMSVAQSFWLTTSHFDSPPVICPTIICQSSASHHQMWHNFSRFEIRIKIVRTEVLINNTIMYSMLSGVSCDFGRSYSVSDFMIGITTHQSLLGYKTDKYYNFFRFEFQIMIRHGKVLMNIVLMHFWCYLECHMKLPHRYPISTNILLSFCGKHLVLEIE